MSETANEPVSKEQIEETILELEKYRQRLVEDIVQMGKKIKLSKKKVEQNINAHPEIVKIDGILEKLRSSV